MLNQMMKVIHFASFAHKVVMFQKTMALIPMIDLIHIPGAVTQSAAILL